MKFWFVIFILIFDRSLVCSQSITNGLIACFPFNGNSIDATGRGYNTGTEDAVLTTDRFARKNSAYYLNGFSSFLEVNTNGLQLDAFSISLWVNVKKSITKNQFIWSVGSILGVQSIFVDPILGFVAKSSISETESIICTSNILPNSGNWYCLVMVRGINYVNFYVNNKLVHSKSNILEPFYGYKSSIPRAGIGRTVAGEPYFLNGDVDDIHLYNRPLTDNEVKLLYEGEKQPEIKLSVDNASPCNGETVVFTVSGASSSADYLWKYNKKDTLTTRNFLELPTKPANKDVELKVSVEIVDLLNCFPQKPRLDSTTINIKECRELFNLNIPNIFSPNNDGINDTWEIPNLNRIPEALITIYDRRGTLVFQSLGYEKPWNGKLFDKFLPPDTYVFTIITNIKDEKVLQGTVVIAK